MCPKDPHLSLGGVFCPASFHPVHPVDSRRKACDEQPVDTLWFQDDRL
jgi:hypothetical protein